MMWDGGMGWMWSLWLLLVVGTVVVALVLVRALTGRRDGRAGRSGTAAPSTDAGPRRSRDILEERYARGEIGTEDYRERLRILEEDGR